MKPVFLLGLLLGFAGVLALAHYFPWVDHGRVPARTEVIPNGGRAERFVIWLPADRLVASGASETGLRGEPAPGGRIAVASSQPWLFEQFKLRDVDGKVIGVAARHWSITPDGPETTWCLVIPGRGALYMSGPGEASHALDDVLNRAGYRPDAAWSGTARLDLGANGGRVISGSEEFDQFLGQYSEVWALTGVSETGELHGTIELATQTYHGI
jgi:hypothetical protein